MSSGVESEDESTSVQSTPRGSDGVGMRVENGMAVHGFGDPFAGAGDEFTQQEREMEMQLDAEREIERIEVPAVPAPLPPLLPTGPIHPPYPR